MAFTIESFKGIMWKAVWEKTDFCWNVFNDYRKVALILFQINETRFFINWNLTSVVIFVDK